MKFLRKILKCFSFTAALFVVQACYGVYSDYEDYDDVLEKNLTFRVSDSENNPIGGVIVNRKLMYSNCSNCWEIDTTNSDGIAKFTLILLKNEGVMFRFDGNNSYIPKDTFITNFENDFIEIKLSKK